MLQAIQTDVPKIFFKGGTLLSKVYAGFNRLSEDLDFTVSLPATSKRSERSNAVAPFKDIFSEIPSKISGIQVSRPLKGSNNSVQYNGELTYRSCLEDRDDRILFEIGLREELQQPHALCDAHTLLIDPLLGKPMLSIFQVASLSKEEAYTEKIRAALTRERAAIRDIYDLDYALARGIVSEDNQELFVLIAKKIMANENSGFRVDEQRKRELLLQLDTQLRSVLRPQDFKAFNFERAWTQVVKMAGSLKPYLGE